MLIQMEVIVLIKSFVITTRAWRERLFHNLQDQGCKDLSHRPKSGMSSVGWLLGHQGAAYDYTLNMLIKGKSPKNPDMFYAYVGDSTDNGDWKGNSLEEINGYFTSVETDFLTWFEQVSDKELNRILEGPETPQFFQGMRVLEAITHMFVHLNYHNGHLSAIKGDWCQQEEK